MQAFALSSLPLKVSSEDFLNLLYNGARSSSKSLHVEIPIVCLGFGFLIPISKSRIEVSGKGICLCVYSDTVRCCSHLHGQSWSPTSMLQFIERGK